MTKNSYNLRKSEPNGNVNDAFEKDFHEIQLNALNGPTAIIKEDPPRDQFEKPIEFLLSCIALSVGLGNIWRFPFTAYENGGGAFLIPYFVVLFLIGKPMYFLEMAIGQFSSKGQVKVWKMAPIFKGIGFGSAFGTGCVCSYYCSIMALTIFYFFQSFQSVLPWSVCNEDWKASHNYTCANNSVVGSNKSNPELYFTIDVTKEKEQIDNGIGKPDLRLAICLLLSWITIFVCLIKGVKSAGKAAYFTALFPYFVLLILLVRGLTLEGSSIGIKYLLEPKWEKLLETKVWAAAVTQNFFSLSTAMGPIIMFSSFNPFNFKITYLICWKLKQMFFWVS